MGRNYPCFLVRDMLRWWHFDLTCHRHALDKCLGTNGARDAQDE